MARGLAGATSSLFYLYRPPPDYKETFRTSDRGLDGARHIMAMLTIAIPTYNRNDYLLRLVRSLIEQLTEDCEVLILDNGSTVPARTTLEEGIANFENYPVRIVRYDANIGQPMLRCIELCNTPWMWGLTNKTILRPDAISIILNTILEHRDCIFINFTPYQQERQGGRRRPVSIETKGQSELIGNIIEYGAIIDYMANVFHVPSYQASLGVGYLHAGSGAPQFAIVLHAVGEEGMCYLSSEIPMERPPTPTALQQWSQLDYFWMYMSPLSLVRDARARAILKNHIFGFIPSRKYFVSKFLQMSLRDKSEAKYYFSLYKYFMYCHDKRLTTRLILLAGHASMIFPKLCFSVLESVAKTVFGRSLIEADETLRISTVVR